MPTQLASLLKMNTTMSVLFGTNQNFLKGSGAENLWAAASLFLDTNILYEILSNSNNLLLDKQGILCFLGPYILFFWYFYGRSNMYIGMPVHNCLCN